MIQKGTIHILKGEFFMKDDKCSQTLSEVEDIFTARNSQQTL